MKCCFAAAVLKGIIEHDDGSIYFGALGGYSHWLQSAVVRGWVRIMKTGPKATAKGWRVYIESRLDLLPNLRLNRAYLWDWSKTKIAE